ncbi:hypothetical protein SGM_5420 [Streptomyces griseoaurantiacus M045]|uniref:Uncharacterized protein n=1 Tax=Streptomyces griseoaurantiacus M045 TaxID=996637 RepID=F3NPT5_9ACTN|nr:hypothetical protein SGM_5420 [Streptomyces griseoaurantiacus M045]
MTRTRTPLPVPRDVHEPRRPRAGGPRVRGNVPVPGDG